jgi:spore coat polysaccharide biosynthesis predicted glycosyltransferase SpsG
MILFCPETSQKAGFGHIMRMCTLFDFLKDDFSCQFVIEKSTHSQTFHFSKNLIPYQEVNSLKCDILLDLFLETKVIIFDGYNFRPELIQEYKKQNVLTIHIEDFADTKHLPDILINHSPGANEKMYPKMHSLTGPLYSLINPVFYNSNEYEREEGHIFLTYGGADPLKLCKPTIESLFKTQLIKKVTLVVGNEKYANELKETLPRDLISLINIKYRISTFEMAKIMHSCEFGVCPASTVAMEACAAKLPILVTQTIDNQELYRRGFIERELALFIEMKAMSNNEKLSQAIIELRNKKNIITEQQNKYFDGKSKQRIVREISKNLNHK